MGPSNPPRPACLQPVVFGIRQGDQCFRSDLIEELAHFSGPSSQMIHFAAQGCGRTIDRHDVNIVFRQKLRVVENFSTENESLGSYERDRVNGSSRDALYSNLQHGRICFLSAASDLVPEIAELMDETN
eukprot:767720-Hanusia_phi.AAC.4